MNDQSASTRPREPGADGDQDLGQSIRSWLRGFRRWRNGESGARDTLDELIEEREDQEVPIDEDERLLLANILELRGRTVHDVMVPRADIICIPADAGLDELIDLIAEEGHSRIPVYRESLDDAIGMVHIKDVLTWRGRDEEFQLAKLVRKILFVAPSMQVLELLLEMRVKRSHMALVVDEFGGVDGLVTIEDLVEEIVGEIEDEHDRADVADLVRLEDASFLAEARCPIETLEGELGKFVADEEREEIDTLGGLVFALAGHVPIRGEIVNHPSGIEFEVLDADPRRIKKLRVRQLQAGGETEARL